MQQSDACSSTSSFDDDFGVYISRSPNQIQACPEKMASETQSPQNVAFRSTRASKWSSETNTSATVRPSSLAAKSSSQSLSSAFSFTETNKISTSPLRPKSPVARISVDATKDPEGWTCSNENAYPRLRDCVNPLSGYCTSTSGASEGCLEARRENVLQKPILSDSNKIAFKQSTRAHASTKRPIWRPSSAPLLKTSQNTPPKTAATEHKSRKADRPSTMADARGTASDSNNRHPQALRPSWTVERQVSKISSISISPLLATAFTVEQLRKTEILAKCSPD